MPPDLRSQVLVVDDDAAVAQVLCALLAQAGTAATAVDRGEAALAELDRKPYDLVITDVRMPGLGGMELLDVISQRLPGLPVVLLTAHGTVAMAVDAMKRGATDFLQKPFDREEILYVVRKALDASKRDRERPPRPPETPPALEGLVGPSPAMQAARELLRKAAPTTATMLIRGESGTGKELAARALHALSPRAAGPFVRLSCGALPEALLEAELLGYEKGAFAGAVQRKPGRVELAAGGTLFLDEVGDVPVALQVKLLRLVQEREFERVGGSQVLTADVRLVAATQRPLEEMVKAGTFREDLLYRLTVVPLSLPPLRARPGDVAALARHFCARLAREHRRKVELSDEAVAALEAQPWPGNVRQLQNLLERLVVLADVERLKAEDVVRELGREAVAFPAATPPGPPVNATLMAQRRDTEREAVRRAMQKAGGNRTLAARLLGVSRRTLYNKLEALGLTDE